MATSTIEVKNPAVSLYRGLFPNGESVLSVPPGLYRTETNHLPSEGIVGNQYGVLLILKSNDPSYSFVMYVGLQGQSGVYSTY